MDESGESREEIAKKLGISRRTLERRLNNDGEFRFGEIKRLCEILGLGDDIDKEQIFFAKCVENKPTELVAL